MADLSPTPGSNDDTGVGPGRGSTRRRPRWVMVFGIILVKLGVIALILVLPFELAISLGAAHGVALLVLLVVAAVTLVVYRLRGRTLNPAALLHRPPRGHRFVLGWWSAKVARIFDNKGRK
jgi:amino acid transporter